jgi:hypothetical protein
VDGLQLVAALGVVIMIGLAMLAARWLRDEQAAPATSGETGSQADGGLVAESAGAR